MGSASSTLLPCPIPTYLGQAPPLRALCSSSLLYFNMVNSYIPGTCPSMLKPSSLSLLGAQSLHANRTSLAYLTAHRGPAPAPPHQGLQHCLKAGPGQSQPRATCMLLCSSSLGNKSQASFRVAYIRTCLSVFRANVIPLHGFSVLHPALSRRSCCTCLFPPHSCRRRSAAGPKSPGGGVFVECSPPRCWATRCPLAGCFCQSFQFQFL